MSRFFGVSLMLVAVVLVARPATQVTNSLVALPALGGPIPTTGSWVPFSWTAGPGVFNDAGAGTFTGAFQLSVTDAGLDGDRFEIYDFGVLIGATSVPVDDGTFQGDPDLALADSRFSSGSFVLGAGPHSITIRTTQVSAGFPSGTGFVRLTAAALPVFTKAFTPASIASGGTSTLSFTIDNTASLGTTASLAFAGTLPADVRVATPSNATNTCSGTLSVDGAIGTIVLTDGTVAAASTCTVSVDVTSVTVGAHASTIGDLTSSAGNSGAASATLTVLASVPALPPGGMLVLAVLLVLVLVFRSRRRRLA